MEEALPGLRLHELADLLGSRPRALAARRWLGTVRPLPAELPPRIPGVAPGPWTRVVHAAPMCVWQLAARQVSLDGTVKLAVSLRGDTVETVMIPTRSRSTVCVSSQAGCTRACVFCATATLGFRRNLSAAEMVLQVLLAGAEAPAGAPARNVVFMGMGEPMDNLDAVMRAVDVLMEPPAPALAASHITVSTSGVLPGMERFLAEGRGHLALSLNATTDAVRRRVMPHTRTWPIATLLDALRRDQERGSGRRYFIEYVMWDGVNDTAEDARRLVGLLGGLDAHVNLIPHNGTVGEGLRPSSEAAIRAFQQQLVDQGVRTLVRWPRGREIAAACGQLAGRAAS
jgi:23S rRNA (adenine2503-C2)-methyltransferase